MSGYLSQGGFKAGQGYVSTSARIMQGQLLNPNQSILLQQSGMVTASVIGGTPVLISVSSSGASVTPVTASTDVLAGIAVNGSQAIAQPDCDVGVYRVGQQAAYYLWGSNAQIGVALDPTVTSVSGGATLYWHVGDAHITLTATTGQTIALPSVCQVLGIYTNGLTAQAAVPAQTDGYTYATNPVVILKI